MHRLSWLIAAMLVQATAFAAVVTGYGLHFGLLVIATPVLLYVMRRPQRAILIFVAVAPFEGLLLLTGGDGRGPLAAWKQVLVVVALAASVAGRRANIAEAGPVHGHPRRLFGPFRPSWALPLALFFLLSVASATRVPPLTAAVGLKTLFFGALLGVLALRCPLNDRERDQLVSILMATAAVCAVVGLSQQVIGHEALRELGYRYNSTIRFSGSFLRSFSTFPQPFAFGFYEMFVILLGVAVALGDPKRVRNRWFLLALPLLGLGLLSSLVRTAWIGTAVGLVWLGIARHRVLLSAIPVVVAVLLVVPNEGNTNALSSRSGEERTSSWVANAPVVYENPLGVGVGTSGAAAGRVIRIEGGPRGYQQEGLSAESGAAYNPDNHYFKVALELGLPGLWLWLLVLVGVFVEAKRVLRRGRGEEIDLAAGLGAWVVAAAVASVSATFFEIFPNEYLFWLLAGVVAGLGRSAPAPEPATRSAGRRALPLGAPSS